MSPEASDTFSFLCPFWSRLAIPPWLLSLLVLTVLAAARFYSAFGPPQASILFLLHILVMWTLPFLFLTRQGRRDIGLHRGGITPVALFLSSWPGWWAVSSFSGSGWPYTATRPTTGVLAFATVFTSARCSPSCLPRPLLLSSPC